MKQITIVLILICCFDLVRAQTDTSQADTDSTIIIKAVTIEQVVVTGFSDSDPKATSLNIEPYGIKELDSKVPFNLSDALSSIPGISQMTTGNCISKPVLRGLYGNRVLVLFSGLRFDNQQWQDEHGLGLSQIGIDRIEVIKGPASLLYGTDALGGVINIVETYPHATDARKLDFTTRFYGTTLGTLTDIGYQRAHGNGWWQLRAGYESNADYADGNNDRVLNSRNQGYYFKGGFGVRKDRRQHYNYFNSSYNQYGFILDGLQSFFVPDERWTRKMNGPHHIVALNVFSTQNIFHLGNSTFRVNGGLQSNLRKEDEGSGDISLNMLLVSGLENLRWEKPFNKKILLVVNQQFTTEKNTNNGKRVIIPDARTQEINFSALLRTTLNKIILEFGAGVNDKIIQTFETAKLNNSDKAVHPFKNNYVSGNGMLGLSYNPKYWLNIKANASTGLRAPNLAELSSNGLHEGTYQWEIGNPDLKPEQNLSADLTFEIDHKQLFTSASAYFNNFFDYIYLAPTDEDTISFQIFRYLQQDAKLYGGEALFIYKPSFVKHLQWRESFAITRGTLDEGGYLPFIPAYKLLSSLKLVFDKAGKVNGLFAEPEMEYVFKQDHPAQFEMGTDDYFLLNFNVGFNTSVKSTTFEWRVSLKNILNEAYYDHLSRLKYYGILNQGINVAFSLKVNFDLGE